MWPCSWCSDSQMPPYFLQGCIQFVWWMHGQLACSNFIVVKQEQEVLLVYLPYLEMVRELQTTDPCVWHFNIPLRTYFMPQQSHWPSLSADKVYRSHLVPQITGLGVLFHHNQSFNNFEAFCITFLLDFHSSQPPWHCSFRFSFLQTRRSNWVHFFFMCCPPPRLIMWWSALTPLRKEPLW